MRFELVAILGITLSSVLPVLSPHSALNWVLWDMDTS